MSSRPGPSRGHPPLDLSRPRRLHLVGIGGAGMSAYASVLAAMGHVVTGSDLKSSATVDRLRAAGVAVEIGHDPAHVGDAEVVAVSSAIGEQNPEVAEARRRGIPVVHRAELLASIAALRRTVAVAGTHGKTTTTSMLALILVEAGIAPSFLIGGDLNEVGTNAVWDEGEWLVLEADESDGTFLYLDPDVAVVTNVEPDHLDHFGDVESLQAAFEVFCTGRRGGVVVGADDPVAAAIGARHGALSAGLDVAATYRIDELRQGPDGVAFELRHGDQTVAELALAVPGIHNARNAAVAAVAAAVVGASFEAAGRALARFAGVARRFEYRGEHQGVRYVDDYAHLPTEVAAALQAARTATSGRIVAVFQPHRYSRTAALGAGFADAFTGADLVVVTDVYGAGERPLPGVTGRLVADAVSGSHPELEVIYLATRSELQSRLPGLLRPGDLCLTLGAGDLTSLPDELMGRPA